MERYYHIFESVKLHIEYGLLAALFGTALETILPGQERHSIESRLKGAGFALLYYLTATAAIFWIRHNLASLGGRASHLDRPHQHSEFERALD